MSMKKMRKATMAAMVFLGCVCAPVAATVSYAQLTDAQGNAVESDTSKQTTESGGGFYDKFLAAEPKHPTLALCYEFQMLPHLDTEEFDIPVDLVLWA